VLHAHRGEHLPEPAGTERLARIGAPVALGDPLEQDRASGGRVEVVGEGVEEAGRVGVHALRLAG